MTQQEWENATDEEKEAELNKCSNPIYVYNTYYKRPDMQELTFDQYVEMIAYSRLSFLKLKHYPKGEYFEYVKQQAINELFNPNQLTQGI